MEPLGSPKQQDGGIACILVAFDGAAAADQPWGKSESPVQGLHEPSGELARKYVEQ